MISVWWTIPVFLIGGIFGMILTALMIANGKDGDR